METLVRQRRVSDIRRENVRLLFATHGGPTNLALKLGYKTGSYIAQVAGPTPIKRISEDTARYWEWRLGLGAGWLDHPQAVAPAQVSDRKRAITERRQRGRR